MQVDTFVVVLFYIDEHLMERCQGNMLCTSYKNGLLFSL